MLVQRATKALRSFSNLRAKYKMRGDTIVEVLISIAIVGAVVTGAYALASHSLQQGISSAEHTKASKLAEAQVEALKFRRQTIQPPAVWTTNFTTGAGSNGKAQNFCLNGGATKSTDPGWLPINNGGDPTVLDSGFGKYDPSCVSEKYFINITSTPNSAANASNPTYLVTVRWLPIGADGSHLSQSQLYYRF